MSSSTLWTLLSRRGGGARTWGDSTSDGARSGSSTCSSPSSPPAAAVLARAWLGLTVCCRRGGGEARRCGGSGFCPTAAAEAACSELRPAAAASAAAVRCATVCVGDKGDAGRCGGGLRGARMRDGARSSSSTCNSPSSPPAAAELAMDWALRCSAVGGARAGLFGRGTVGSARRADLLGFAAEPGGVLSAAHASLSARSK
eukprot:scaffold103389_cov45-Phaeocystis_antarctica.AAC.1